MPRVSIIVPAFNVASTLADTLQSLIEQTYQDFDVIIVDDGSTDSTRTVAKPFLQDRRFWYVHQANRGLSGARNRGIAEASGEYIGFCDADDMWHPDKLRRHVQHLDRNPHIGVSYSGSQMIDAQGRPLPVKQKPRLKGITAANILKRNPIGNGSAAVIRRAVFDDIAYIHHATDGGFFYFDETLRQSEDIECWLRIALQTDWGFEGIRGALTLYRIAPSGLSAQTERQLMSWQTAMDKLRPLHPSFFAQNEPAAYAYQLRYLARRAITSGQGAAARAYIARAWRASREPFWAEPVKSAVTLLASLASNLLKLSPQAQKALVNSSEPMMQPAPQAKTFTVFKKDKNL